MFENAKLGFVSSRQSLAAAARLYAQEVLHLICVGISLDQSAVLWLCGGKYNTEESQGRGGFVGKVAPKSICSNFAKGVWGGGVCFLTLTLPKGEESQGRGGFVGKVAPKSICSNFAKGVWGGGVCFLTLTLPKGVLSQGHALIDRLPRKAEEVRQLMQ